MEETKQILEPDPGMTQIFLHTGILKHYNYYGKGSNGTNRQYAGTDCNVIRKMDILRKNQKKMLEIKTPY